MSHPTTRVLTVLELLQARSRMSGADLAARLEVDPRTVRRYITTLKDLGVPVEAEAGRYGGYRLQRGYKLPPMMFTEEEALALALGLLTARRMGLTEAAPAVEGALAKLDRVLPERLRGQVQALQGSLAFTPLRATSRASDPGTLLALTTAAQHNRRVHLRYRAAEQVTERELDPYGVVQHQDRWYVVGWCHLRADVRMFRLDRVQSVVRLEAPFARPLDFDPVAYVLHSLATVPWGLRVEVLLELSVDEARRRVAPGLATLEPAAGGVLLRTQADNLDWMARLLVQVGCPFRIQHPPELRAAIGALVRRTSGYARRASQSRTKTRSPGRSTARSAHVA